MPLSPSFYLKKPQLGLLSFIFFCLFCSTAAYWALVIFQPYAAIAPSQAKNTRGMEPNLAAAKLLFEKKGPKPTEIIDTNVSVVGLIANGNMAFLAVDQQPPKLFFVGETISDGKTLAAVKPESALLEQAGKIIELAGPKRPSVSLLNTHKQNKPAEGIVQPQTDRHKAQSLTETSPSTENPPPKREDLSDTPLPS